MGGLTNDLASFTKHLEPEMGEPQAEPHHADTRAFPQHQQADRVDGRPGVSTAG